MLPVRLAYKHFSCLNLAEVISKMIQKTFKVAPVDGKKTKFTTGQIVKLKTKKKQQAKSIKVVNCNINAAIKIAMYS